MNWRRLFLRKRNERDLADEINAHLSLETRRRLEGGEPAHSASANARKDFGNVELVKEVTRDIWGGAALDRLIKDVRYACRLLFRNPGFTILAVLALGLGIAGTTSMFTVVNAVLLRPLPFPDPARLVMLWEVRPNTGKTNVIQTQNYLDWRARNHSFEAIAAIHPLQINLSGAGEPVQVSGLRVTADFFDILRVRPLMGRTFAPGEDVVGQPLVVVLSHRLFVQRYGGDPNIVGKPISVSGTPAAIVGVMPADFEFPGFRTEIYVVLRINPRTAPEDGRNLRAIARLKSDATVESAREDMQRIAAQTEKERPNSNTKWSATAIALMEQTVGEIRTALLLLFAAVGAVLLIACTNVANLLLMRGAARSHEMNVRMALGAGRFRLVQQLLIESLALASVGGALGVLLSYLGVSAFRRALTQTTLLPRAAEIQFDWRVVLFAATVSLGCGLIFGLLPAVHLRERRLGEGGRTVVRGQRRLRNLLVSFEVASTVILAIAAGLMLRSFHNLRNVDPGFDSSQVLTVSMILVPARYAEIGPRAAFVSEVLDRVRTLPQITAAGSINDLPMVGNSGSDYYRADRPVPRPEGRTGGEISVISPGYFKVMGIPILAGRDFESRDRRGAPRVAILNQAAAEMLFPGEDAIGKRLAVAWDDDPEVEVIGVTGDIRHSSLQHHPDPCLFLPNAQAPNLRLSIVVRTAGNPTAIAAAIKEQIRQVDPAQGIAEVRMMDELVSGATASSRLQAVLISCFGIVALVLLSVGIYGIISYSVAQRTREIGVRLAIGANPRGIRRTILKEGLTLTALGSVAGIVAALALTRYLQTLLFEVTPTDAGVYGIVLLTVFAVAAAACFIPAVRASRVDPVRVLRQD